MDRIAAHFFDIGYKPASAKIYISRLARFSEFANVMRDLLRSVRTLSIVSCSAYKRQAHVSRYGRQRTRAEGRARAIFNSVPLPSAGSRWPAACRLPGSFMPRAWPGTKDLRRTFDGRAQDPRMAPRPSSGSAARRDDRRTCIGLVGHLLSLSANKHTRSSTTSYVRTFLRFLRWASLNGQDLARFVPRTPCWQLQHLPPRLAWEDIRRAIDAIDVTAASGARDRALLLLLATTGLRNKEIRMLELQDIHWRTSEVFVRRTKGKRDRVVPLLDEAGAALADYILHARPKIDNSCVFLSCAPPPRPFKCPASISRIVRSRLVRSGVKLSGSVGAHLLRHGLATQLVRQRRPINEVADLLGHRSIDTTAIYVKVALPQLTDVALPFPGGAS